MSLRNFQTIEERRKFIEKKLKKRFEAVGVYPKGLEEARFKNCENMIGVVQIPLGLAGPLKIKGECVRGDYYLPLSTTEGALVASVNRGCKAITLSGGVRVYTENVGMTRGSIFKTNNLGESFFLKKWVDDNFPLIAKQAERTSSHLKLLRIFSKIIGRDVFMRFFYDTQDAMGMNMVTIATDTAAKLIEVKTGVRCLSLAGNFDIDKKPAFLNFILGRGRAVWAEATISNQIVKEVLKTTSEEIHKLAISKCLIGSALSGSLGFNAHFANIIAALFLALGQDMAHVVEGSLGVTATELIENDLYLSVHLPDLPIGTVGGGTNLPSQREAFSILGLLEGNNGKNARSLTEIIGAAVLAGELSLLASLAEGSLASSHQRLARNKFSR